MTCVQSSRRALLCMHVATSIREMLAKGPSALLRSHFQRVDFKCICPCVQTVALSHVSYTDFMFLFEAAPTSHVFVVPRNSKH